MNLAAMSDAELAHEIDALDGKLAEENPETMHSYLASPEGQSHGLGYAHNMRLVIAQVTDWRLCCRADYADELARRRKAASPHSSQKAPAGLYFGPWRGF